MIPQVTIITPTYNKPTYFAQCAESVLAQTYQRWIWWVVFNFNNGTFPFSYSTGFLADPRILPIEYPVSPRVRQESHVTARIVNWAYPKVNTPYIYFLADDDLIDPDGLAVLVDSMETNHTWDACYGRCEVQNEQSDGTLKTACWCFDGQDVGKGTDIEPDCRLDSSQILHTKELWSKATADGWQLTDNIQEAAHSDGLLLNRLAEFATFHYIPQRINIHRRTKLSSWHKPQLS